MHSINFVALHLKFHKYENTNSPCSHCTLLVTWCVFPKAHKKRAKYWAWGGGERGGGRERGGMEGGGERELNWFGDMPTNFLAKLFPLNLLKTALRNRKRLVFFRVRTT